MSASELHFTAEQEPQVENYHPLCGLAVTALVFGALSPLAVLSTALLVVPLAGAATAGAALWRIRASDGDLSGRRLAVIGLIAACFFGAWGGAQDAARRWMVARQARQFSDQWLALLAQGDVLEADQWMIAPHDRVPPQVDLAAYYQRSERSPEDRLPFFEALPVKLGFPEAPLREYRYLGSENFETFSAGELQVVQRYAIVYEKQGEPHTATLQLTVRRAPSAESGFVHWQLYDVRLES